MKWYRKLTNFHKNNPVLFWLIGGSSLSIGGIAIFFFRVIKNYIVNKVDSLFLLEIQVNFLLLLAILFTLIIMLIVYRINMRKLKLQDKKIYFSIIEAASKLLRFDEWKEWTSMALSPQQMWHKDAFGKIEDFCSQVFSCIWPGTLPELERALKTLSQVMKDVTETFLEHAELNGDCWRGVKFYHIDEWNKELYDELSRKYDEWVDRCDSLILEATKATNWVADVVRRYLDPNFFATRGKFILVSGPYEDLKFRRHIPEYTKKERKGMPYKRLKRG